MDNTNQGHITDYFTQKELDDLFPVIVTLDPEASIEKVEKVSLYDLSKDSTPSPSPDLKDIGVIRITLEDGSQYYLQEGQDHPQAIIVDMYTPLPDKSVFRERMYANAIEQHKKQIEEERKKVGGKHKKSKSKSKRSKKHHKNTKHKRTTRRKRRKSSRRK